MGESGRRAQGSDGRAAEVIIRDDGTTAILDFTLRVNHRLGSDTRLGILASSATCCGDHRCCMSLTM